VTNHEIARSVSRVFLDKTFKPVKGEYIVNGAGGLWRLCSATLATPQEHGFGPIYLTAGESGPESMVHAIDPLAPADPSNTERVKPALGKASMENAVPLPKDAYPAKRSSSSAKTKATASSSPTCPNTWATSTTASCTCSAAPTATRWKPASRPARPTTWSSWKFRVPKPSPPTRSSRPTFSLNAIQFARVEDIDYRKGGGANGREIYFTATGVSQPDKVTPVPGKTMWGRVYKLNLDAANPLKGKLSFIADGSVDPGNNIVNPDNVCVTENYVYIQEDGDSYYLENKHDGRVWQYNIGSKELKPMIEMNHRRPRRPRLSNASTTRPTTTGLSNPGGVRPPRIDIFDLVRSSNTFLRQSSPPATPGSTPSLPMQTASGRPESPTGVGGRGVHQTVIVIRLSAGSLS
jgi:hypothetical protein